MIAANNPSLKSWITVPENSDFPIQNLPFGIFKIGNGTPRAGVAIGKQVLDLAAVEDAGLFSDQNLPTGTFSKEILNDFMSLGKPTWTATRNRISELLRSENQEIQGNDGLRAKAIVSQADVVMVMPMRVGDYTDFYASKEHATNVGTMFRDPNNALLPNWLHIPVGYHGRASSVVISGTPLHRPKGQTKTDDAEVPGFGPCRLLDFELEMGFVIGTGNKLGHRIKVENAEDHIFGMVVFNDWSARDIQKWEYVPLGPFLGKNFGSSISPWIVTMDALEPFRVADTPKEKDILPYLQTSGKHNFDIKLQAAIQTEKGDEKVVSNSNYKYMYWSMAQMIAHHTVNGCDLNPGDLLATGTISGPTPDSYGSMLEISWKGTKPIQMPDGTERRFIADGDIVIMRGHCEKDGVRIGFGEVTGKVLPALD